MTSPRASDETPMAADVAPVPSSVRGAADGGPGRTIRVARERLALSLEALAAQTRLARGTLEALERDDFGTLNEPVYVKGYYRKCAKALGLSESELIAAYERQVGPRQPQAPTKLLLAGDRGLGKGRRGSFGGGGLRWLGVLVAAALIGGLAYWYSGNSGAIGLGRTAPGGESSASAAPAVRPAPAPLPSTAPSREEPVPAPAAPSASSAPSASTVASAPATSPSGATAPSHSGTASEPSPAAGGSVAVPVTAAPPASTGAATAATATSAATVAGEGGLALSFKGTSWVRIEDADNTTLLSGVIQAGDHKVVRGKTPYSVFLGNAPDVRLEFSGRPFDVTPYIKQNSTARFSVPQ